MPVFPNFPRFHSSCLIVSGAVALFLSGAVPTQAQTPMFNVAEYADYSGKTDAEASSVAAQVARRSAAAPQSAAGRARSTTKNVQNAATAQNTSNASTLTRRSGPATVPSNARRNAPKSQAAQTWEAFLFGTPNRPLSTPKFAFAQRAETASPTRLAHSPSAVQTAQPRRVAQPLQPLQTAQTDAPASDAEIAAARRRRLQELNAILAARRPEEFSRRLALADAADSPELPILTAEPVAAPSAGVLRDRAELVRDAAPFDAARANRSKIRQASNLEPANLEPAETLELADDGLAAFLLPTRPNALRLSPNVFLSTDLVPLPSAAPLREIPENAPTPQPTQSVQSLRPTQPLQSAPNAQTPATVATPLPAEEASTDVPTLRPTAQFVEPRQLPTSR